MARLIIEAGRADRHYWADLWRYRELFWFLSWRDVLVRYKQTAIGIAWSVIRPLVTTIVFTVVFGHWAHLDAVGAPYPVMVFAAMLPWQFFSNALTESSNALIANSNLLTKVYFPRLIVPASSVIVSLIDFAISLVLFAILMGYYGLYPDWRVVFLPLFLGLAFIVSFGLGLWFAALNVRYRDFRYVVPFVVQIGFYVSPVALSSTIVPERWRLLYSMNPMVGVIDGFRWSLLRGQSPLDMQSLGISIGVGLVVLLGAIRYFRHTERSFADVI
ncbi:MAG TPA: ABC transporter permease [Kofleriaceae bacterium]|nr:ABC transporter permease [Kofleriaceae bacterium]